MKTKDKYVTQEMLHKSIEELALMVKKGFDDMGRQFKEVYAYMDKRFDAVDRRFDAVDKRFEDMDKRFDRLETKMDHVEDATFKDHAPRIRRIEKKLEIA